MLNIFGPSSLHLVAWGMMLMASGCGLSSGWKTERYRDQASGTETVVAKQRFKQDQIELGAAAKCVSPGQLALEFTASDNFKLARAGDKDVIAYRLGLNGQIPTLLHASFVSPDTLVIARKPAADGPGAALDLGRATRIFVQLYLDSGPTSIVLNPGDTGIRDVFKACGIDPAEVRAAAAQQLTGSTELHRPAAPITPPPKASMVSLKTISSTWACSGDLGDFTFTINDYRYEFSEDSPWSAISGRVSVGAAQAGVDDNATFPITFEGGPWDNEDLPWSYSPVGQGGTIYYISTRTGQSAQCMRGS